MSARTSRSAPRLQASPSPVVAALYARKSTEQTGVTDEQRSVTRQIEHARAWALARGWVVRDEYVFVDDGISGAEFQKRPGLTRLLNMFRPRPPFQVLVTSEESRLGREQNPDGLRHPADPRRRRPHLLLPRRPGADARLGHGQGPSLGDRLRRRDGAGTGTAAHV